MSTLKTKTLKMNKYASSYDDDGTRKLKLKETTISFCQLSAWTACAIASSGITFVTELLRREQQVKLCSMLNSPSSRSKGH
jgi:alpha-D-ribose 1-methylphosphonate 5-triphosphate synthase subunit PhnL